MNVYHIIYSYDTGIIISKEESHNKYALSWAVLMSLCLILGLMTLTFDFGDFWNGYVLDMVGPAWTYILVRGRFTTYTENQWTKFFTPEKTLLLIIPVLYIIEMMQYIDLYDSTFDPYDLLAYVSLVLPIYLMDIKMISQSNRV